MGDAGAGGWAAAVVVSVEEGACSRVGGLSKPPWAVVHGCTSLWGGAGIGRGEVGRTVGCGLQGTECKSVRALCAWPVDCSGYGAQAARARCGAVGMGRRCRSSLRWCLLPWAAPTSLLLPLPLPLAHALPRLHPSLRPIRTARARSATAARGGDGGGSLASRMVELKLTCVAAAAHAKMGTQVGGMGVGNAQYSGNVRKRG